MVPFTAHRAFPPKQSSWTSHAMAATFLLVHLALLLLSPLTVAIPTASSTGSCLLTVDNQCNANGSRCNSCGSCISAVCVVPTNSTTALPPPQDCSRCDVTTQICWGGGCVERAGNGFQDLCVEDTRCVVYRNTTIVATTTTIATDSSDSFTLPQFSCDSSTCTVQIFGDSPFNETTTSFVISSLTPSPTSNVSDIAIDNSTVPTSVGIPSNPPTGDTMTATMIALIVCCSVIFIAGFIWITRGLCRYDGCCFTRSFFARDRDDVAVSSAAATLGRSPSSTTQPAAQNRRTRPNRDAGDHEVGWDDGASARSALTEPLPVYVSPDAPPPKYEAALVMEIAGVGGRRDQEVGSEEMRGGELWMNRRSEEGLV